MQKRHHMQQLKLLRVKETTKIWRYSDSPLMWVSKEQDSLFVLPELSSVRDYVITHSVCSMCVYVCVLG